jgi:GTP-binding protein EngB required for normal cell division
MPGFGRMIGAGKRFERRANIRIIRFFEYNVQNIVLTVHVLDISTFLEVTRRLEKKGIISIDVEMVQFLTTTLGESPLVAANKIDKENEETIAANLNEFIHRISQESPSAVASTVFPVSAKTRKGIGALKRAIHARLVTAGYRTPFKKR